MSDDRKPSPLPNKVSAIDIERSNSQTSDSKLVLGKSDSCEEKKTSCTSVAVKLVVSTLCGIIFGIMLEKARVFEPKAIRTQMVFETFIMLKMFLSAVASGQICLSILSLLPWTKSKFTEAFDAYTESFDEKGVLTSAIGAFALGSGMTLSGACPGMVLVQVGTWVPNAIFTLIGVLIGALTYGLVAPFIIRVTKPKAPYEKKNASTTFKVPFIALALPMAVFLSLTRTNPEGVNVVTALSWPPYASGIFVGVLQIPLVLFVGDTVGGSSAYVTLVSQWVITKKLQELFPYLAKKRTGVENWWQVFYIGGAIFGAVVSALASSSLTKCQGAQWTRYFWNGYVSLAIIYCGTIYVRRRHCYSICNESNRGAGHLCEYNGCSVKKLYTS
ncbi:hypothetical protein KUTeg_011006 [Tegillarca granosa]|uniref:Sulphur transport domain-containing protein n=1 Tax=Tegillarca granosa TaxID=220873 RepID=A0ABQ9F617_TEGGR|nr:hypothetical protein KUTeg_011006 [Tegillarca granosa]